MQSPEREVSVAVVSWNTRELLLQCLRSLQPDMEAGLLEVSVVDNGSSDGSAEAVRSQAPWARLIQAGHNLGFGPAVNLAAERTGGAWLLVANADVAFEPGAVSTLLGAAADPRVGAVAPRLILPDGATQHSVYPLPTVPLTLAFNLGLHHLSRRTGDRLCLEGFWDSERPRAVPWAIGACVLFRRAAFDDVGGFDQSQWMYAEDLDLGWRLHDRGWITRYEPSARVRHASGAAASLAFGEERAGRFLAATYEMLHRRRGAVRMWATGVINLLGAAGRVAWMSPAAFVFPRWKTPSGESRKWLRAHLHGLRFRSTNSEPS